MPETKLNATVLIDSMLIKLGTGGAEADVFWTIDPVGTWNNNEGADPKGYAYLMEKASDCVQLLRSGSFTGTEFEITVKIKKQKIESLLDPDAPNMGSWGAGDKNFFELADEADHLLKTDGKVTGYVLKLQARRYATLADMQVPQNPLDKNDDTLVTINLEFSQEKWTTFIKYCPNQIGKSVDEYKLVNQVDGISKAAMGKITKFRGKAPGALIPVTIPKSMKDWLCCKDGEIGDEIGPRGQCTYKYFAAGVSGDIEGEFADPRFFKNDAGQNPGGPPATYKLHPIIWGPNQRNGYLCFEFTGSLKKGTGEFELNWSGFDAGGKEGEECVEGLTCFTSDCDDCSNMANQEIKEFLVKEGYEALANAGFLYIAGEPFASGVTFNTGGQGVFTSYAMSARSVQKIKVIGDAVTTNIFTRKVKLRPSDTNAHAISMILSKDPNSKLMQELTKQYGASVESKRWTSKSWLDITQSRTLEYVNIWRQGITSSLVQTDNTTAESGLSNITKPKAEIIGSYLDLEKAFLRQYHSAAATMGYEIGNRFFTFSAVLSGSLSQGYEDADTAENDDDATPTTAFNYSLKSRIQMKDLLGFADRWGLKNIPQSNKPGHHDMPDDDDKDAAKLRIIKYKDDLRNNQIAYSQGRITEGQWKVQDTIIRNDMSKDELIVAKKKFWDDTLNISLPTIDKDGVGDIEDITYNYSVDLPNNFKLNVKGGLGEGDAVTSLSWKHEWKSGVAAGISVNTMNEAALSLNYSAKQGWLKEHNFRIQSGLVYNWEQGDPGQETDGNGTKHSPGTPGALSPSLSSSLDITKNLKLALKAPLPKNVLDDGNGNDGAGKAGWWALKFSKQLANTREKNEKGEVVEEFSFGFSAGLGPKYESVTKQKIVDGIPSKYMEVTNIGTIDFSANFNMSYRKELGHVGGMFGRARLKAQVIGQIGSVNEAGVRGFAFGVFGEIAVEIEMRNLSFLGEIFGIGILEKYDIWPKFGIQFGWYVGKVESAFGNTWAGSRFSVGFGLIGWSFGKRQDEIKSAIRKHKMNTGWSGAITKFLPDILNWKKKETDEQYITRVVPQLLYLLEENSGIHVRRAIETEFDNPKTKLKYVTRTKPAGQTEVEAGEWCPNSKHPNKKKCKLGDTFEYQTPIDAGPDANGNEVVTLDAGCLGLIMKYYPRSDYTKFKDDLSDVVDIKKGWEELRDYAHVRFNCLCNQSCAKTGKLSGWANEEGDWYDTCNIPKGHPMERKYLWSQRNRAGKNLGPMRSSLAQPPPKAGDKWGKLAERLWYYNSVLEGFQPEPGILDVEAGVFSNSFGKAGWRVNKKIYEAIIAANKACSQNSNWTALEIIASTPVSKENPEGGRTVIANDSCPGFVEINKKTQDHFEITYVGNCGDMKCDKGDAGECATTTGRAKMGESGHFEDPITGKATCYTGGALVPRKGKGNYGLVFRHMVEWELENRIKIIADFIRQRMVSTTAGVSELQWDDGPRLFGPGKMDGVWWEDRCLDVDKKKTKAEDCREHGLTVINGAYFGFVTGPQFHVDLACQDLRDKFYHAKFGGQGKAIHSGGLVEPNGIWKNCWAFYTGGFTKSGFPKIAGYWCIDEVGEGTRGETDAFSKAMRETDEEGYIYANVYDDSGIQDVNNYVTFPLSYDTSLHDPGRDLHQIYGGKLIGSRNTGLAKQASQNARDESKITYDDIYRTQFERARITFYLGMGTQEDAFHFLASKKGAGPDRGFYHYWNDGPNHHTATPYGGKPLIFRNPDRAANKDGRWAITLDPSPDYRDMVLKPKLFETQYGCGEYKYSPCDGLPNHHFEPAKNLSFWEFLKETEKWYMNKYYFRDPLSFLPSADNLSTIKKVCCLGPCPNPVFNSNGERPEYDRFPIDDDVRNDSSGQFINFPGEGTAAVEFQPDPLRCSDCGLRAGNYLGLPILRRKLELQMSYMSSIKTYEDWNSYEEIIGNSDDTHATEFNGLALIKKATLSMSLVNDPYWRLNHDQDYNVPYKPILDNTAFDKLNVDIQFILSNAGGTREGAVMAVSEPSKLDTSKKTGKYSDYIINTAPYAQNLTSSNMMHYPSTYAIAKDANRLVELVRPFISRPDLIRLSSLQGAMPEIIKIITKMDALFLIGKIDQFTKKELKEDPKKKPSSKSQAWKAKKTELNASPRQYFYKYVKADVEACTMILRDALKPFSNLGVNRGLQIFLGGQEKKWHGNGTRTLMKYAGQGRGTIDLSLTGDRRLRQKGDDLSKAGLQVRGYSDPATEKQFAAKEIVHPRGVLPLPFGAPTSFTGSPVKTNEKEDDVEGEFFKWHDGCHDYTAVSYSNTGPIVGGYKKDKFKEKHGCAAAPFTEKHTNDYLYGPGPNILENGQVSIKARIEVGLDKHGIGYTGYQAAMDMVGILKSYFFMPADPYHVIRLFHIIFNKSPFELYVKNGPGVTHQLPVGLNVSKMTQSGSVLQAVSWASAYEGLNNDPGFLGYVKNEGLYNKMTDPQKNELELLTGKGTSWGFYDSIIHRMKFRFSTTPKVRVGKKLMLIV